MNIPRPLILFLTILIVVVFFKRNEAKPSDTSNEESQAQLDSHKSGDQEVIANSAQATTRSLSPSNPQTSASSTLSDLPDSEQASLWNAFSEARREARPIPEAWAQREENIGYDFYALHPKQNLTTRFGSQGVQFISSDRTYTDADAKNPTTAWEARMHVLSFAGSNVPLGAPAQKTESSSSRVEYRHRAELTEWYDNGVDGMEHGYTVTRRPDHLEIGEEIVLEIGLDGLKASQNSSDCLHFSKDEKTILTYSKLVVFDANGKILPASMTPTDSGFTLAYLDNQAAYPVTIDPLILNAEGKQNGLDASDFDLFGYSVAISGETAVIGAYNNNAAGINSGSAYVFTRNGGIWSQEQQLTASDAETGDSFGDAVAISGESVVIGAFRDDDAGSSSGSAYVFARSGGLWTQESKLTASDAAGNDEFGTSVAISGNIVIVGAPENDDAGNNSGTAYVFCRSNNLWFQQTILAPSFRAANDNFGNSIAISGETAIVSASAFGGSAYVFIRSGSSWLEQARLTPSDPAGITFGRDVAISGDTAIISAFSIAGRAYIFTRTGTTWSQQAKLTASDGAVSDQFGSSVAISGDTVLIGANFDDNDANIDSGSAYLFTRTGGIWSEQEKLVANDAASSDYFGGAVALSGDTAIVGSSQDDDVGNASGSTYIFRFAVPGTRALLVYDHQNSELLNGSEASPFPTQQLDTHEDYFFHLTNAGAQDLDIQSVSLGGTDAGQFSLTVPDISSATDLSQNESLQFSITFSPDGGSSGVRNATVSISSNDPTVPSLHFSLTALALSNSTDEDGDGMNDWAEYSLRGLGYDWTKPQPNEVSTLLDNAATAGLFTEAQLAAVNVSGSLVEVDPIANTAAIVIGLEDSGDMANFKPIVADPSKLSIDGNGKIRYEVDTSPDKKFIRAGVGE